MRKQNNLTIMVVNLNPNEIAIKASDSQVFMENQWVKGKFIVTNQRIYFVVRAPSNNGKLSLEILPEQIREVIYFNGKSLFSKGLNIITKDGKELLFILKKRGFGFKKHLY